MSESTIEKLVLVVDDEHDIRRFLTTLLEDEGYRTVTANDGEHALEILQTERPHLITLDVAMPNKSGVGTYRELRTSEALRDVPVIIITGVAAEFEEFISTRRSVPPPDGYVPKPIDAAKFLETVERLLT